jgi:hypothetical protein
MEEKIGVIEYTGGKIHITSKELLAGGLDPEKMGWEEITKERVSGRKKEYKKLKKELSKMRKRDSATERIEMDILGENVEQAEKAVESAKEDYDKYVVTPNSIAKAAEKHQITKSEVGGVKGFFARILGKDNTKENDGKDDN